MSQSNTNRTKAYLVDAKSVPSCLQHSGTAGILEDAEHLTVFLSEAVNNALASDSEPPDGFRSGLSLAFALLQDKLAIASGELRFPLSTLYSDEADGVLWSEPEGVTHE